MLYYKMNKFEQEAVKWYLRYCDLYESSEVLNYLKDRFTHLSFSPKSIPTAGSYTRTTKELKSEVKIEIYKAMYQNKKNAITLKTNIGYLQFINL